MGIGVVVSSLATWFCIDNCKETRCQNASLFHFACILLRACKLVRWSHDHVFNTSKDVWCSQSLEWITSNVGGGTIWSTVPSPVGVLHQNAGAHHVYTLFAVSMQSSLAVMRAMPQLLCGQIHATQKLQGWYNYHPSHQRMQNVDIKP